MPFPIQLSTNIHAQEFNDVNPLILFLYHDNDNININICLGMNTI